MPVPHRIQILTALVLVFGTSQVLASPKGTAGDSNDGDWVYVDHDLAGTRLTAFDASTGHEKWRYDAAKPMVGGVIATAGDVIFAGELTGNLLALDAKTGKVLLRSDLGGPAGGGVVTYNAGGVQNVAVVSGFVAVPSASAGSAATSSGRVL